VRRRPTVVRRALIALGVAAAPLVTPLLLDRVVPVGADAGPLPPICFPVLDPVTFTDTYGVPRGDGRTHEGIDLMGEKMHRLVASTDGEIVDVRGPGSGDDTYSVRVRDDDGWYHVYLHLNDDTPGTDDGLAAVTDVLGPGIEVGERVAAGQLVGYMGDSGNAEETGAHLHYELREPAPVVWDAVAVNPYDSLVAAQAAGGCAGASGAPVDPSVTRLAGEERVATAAAISVEAYPAPASADAAVLAAADRFPDALAGTPLAAASGGPLLLTDGHELSDVTRDELGRALPEGAEVIVLGGEQAVGAAVEEELSELGYRVSRVAGRDRYETAVAIAHDALGTPDRALVATGLDFPDSLGAGAAAAAIGGAVLLTDGDRLPPSTAAFLADHPEVLPVAVGGQASQALPSAEAVVGENRYSTSVLVAERYFADADVVGVASGRAFPDGLAAGAHVGPAGGPVLVVEPDLLPGEIDDYLAAFDGRIGVAFVYGGDLAVIPSVVDAVLAALTALTALT